MAAYIISDKSARKPIVSELILIVYIRMTDLTLANQCDITYRLSENK